MGLCMLACDVLVLVSTREMPPQPRFSLPCAALVLVSTRKMPPQPHPPCGKGRLISRPHRSTIGRLPSGAVASPCDPSCMAGSAVGGGISRPARLVSAELRVRSGGAPPATARPSGVRRAIRLACGAERLVGIPPVALRSRIRGVCRVPPSVLAPPRVAASASRFAPGSARQGRVPNSADVSRLCLYMSEVRLSGLLRSISSGAIRTIGLTSLTCRRKRQPLAPYRITMCL